MRLLAVGAHLDDVEIACGGAIARAIAHGYEVKMLILSDSSYSNYDGKVLRTSDEALEEGWKAAKILAVSDLEILNFPTKDIPYHSSVVEAIEERINQFNPGVIFTHWPFDTHQAHHNTGLSTLSAARYRTSILMYEPMMPAGRSYVGFRPQIYVDISKYLTRKLDSLKAHVSQYRKYGDAWIEAVESRCRLRGFEMGVKYAEAFEAVRFEWQP
jgi:LmbE family N-acetylglucosaminyl deacetylase